MSVRNGQTTGYFISTEKNFIFVTNNELHFWKPSINWSSFTIKIDALRGKIDTKEL